MERPSIPWVRSPQPLHAKGDDAKEQMSMASLEEPACPAAQGLKERLKHCQLVAVRPLDEEHKAPAGGVGGTKTTFTRSGRIKEEREGVNMKQGT